MSGNSEVLARAPEAFFLPGTAGDLFAVYIPPDRERYRDENVLVVPPFAEEMTRVRRMVSLQARRLAAAGVGTLIVDLYGTGDSAGRFRDASWDTWRSDIATAVSWLQGQGERVSLLGIRLGAILAADFVTQNEGVSLARTVFWNPVLSGEENLREFLLLRVLAGMMQKAMSRVTLEALRDSLANGESVEVAAYELSPTLANEIGRLRLDSLCSPRAAPVHWIELCAPNSEMDELAGQKLIDEWNANGIETKAHALKGFPFWAEWDVRVVNDLLNQTTAIFGGN